MRLPGPASLILALLLACGLAGAARAADAPPRKSTPTHAPWRFALGYEVDDLLVSADVARAFVRDYLVAEAVFFAHARDPKSGLALEGFELDPATGLPIRTLGTGGPAAESLDVALCVKALLGHGKAALVLSPGDPTRAPEVAARILEQKIGTYEKMHRDYPGWGGFLPELSAGPGGPSHTRGHGDASGRWAWALWLAEDALRKKGRGAVAQRFRALNETLAVQAPRIFPDSAEGRPVTRGLALATYVSLFAPGLPAGGSGRLVDGASTTAVETPWGTTWCGSKSGLDEEMAFLFVPLRDDATCGKLFRIRQVIRTRQAVEAGVPGLPSTVGASHDGSGPRMLHPAPDSFTTLEAFPLLLECADSEPPVASNYGAAWLLNMLRGQRMQGPLGGGAGAGTDGRRVVFTKTVGATYPLILAICGGLERETAALLRERGLYKRFRQVAAGVMGAAFRDKEIMELAGFAPPRLAVPVVGITDYEGARPVPSASPHLSPSEKPTVPVPPVKPARPADPAPASKPVVKPAAPAPSAKPVKPADPAPASKPAVKPVDPAPASKPAVKPVDPAPASKPAVKPADPAPASKPAVKPADPAPASKPAVKPADPAPASKPAAKPGPVPPLPPPVP